MPTSQLLYLSRADVEAVALPMPEIIDALEAVSYTHLTLPTSDLV